MEYLEIKEAHRMLYGDDPTEDLSIKIPILRHQVEERLRGGLNEFRQAVVEAKGKRRNMSKVLKRWYTVQQTLIRSISRLAEKTPNVDDDTVIDEESGVVVKIFGLESDIVGKLHTFRETGDGDPFDLADRVLELWRELVWRVDQLEAGTS